MKFNDLKIINKTTVSLKVGDSDYDHLEVVANIKNGFDFYMNGIKKEYDEIIEAEIVSYIKDNIDSNELESIIFNDDYNKIFSQLSFEDICKGYRHDKELIIKQLGDTINYFIKHEKYEKCVILKSLLISAEKL